MAGIIKNAVRLGVISTLAGGAVVLVAGPERCLAVLQQAKQHVHNRIDQNIDDPIALRSQLRDLEAKYPARIEQVEKDLSKIITERAQLEREYTVDQKAVQITRGKLDRLEGVLARGEDLSSKGQFVRLNVEGDRMSMSEGYQRANHYQQLIDTFSSDANAREQHLAVLEDQESTLEELLAQLQAEQFEFQTQLAQLDRQVDAVARNDRLIAMLEERQKAFSKYESRYKAPNLDAVRTAIAQKQAEQERELAKLQMQNETQDILRQAQDELEIRRETRRSLRMFDKPTVEIEPETVEISPEDDEAGSIASRGG
jgi:predicted nuclease with TOPRIM domain